MKNFLRIVKKDILIEVVAIPRATYKEATEFKKILEDDIKQGFRKLVIDIRRCTFIDSTFLGVLVVTLKNIATISGEVRIVKPDSIVSTLMAKAGTLQIFNIYNTIEEAVQSYESSEIINHYQARTSEISN